MPKSFTSSSCLDTTTSWLGNRSRPAPSPPTTASHISPDSTAPLPPPANAARLWRHQQQLTATDAGHGFAGFRRIIVTVTVYAHLGIQCPQSGHFHPTT